MSFIHFILQHVIFMKKRSSIYLPSLRNTECIHSSIISWTLCSYYLPLFLLLLLLPGSARQPHVTGREGDRTAQPHDGPMLPRPLGRRRCTGGTTSHPISRLHRHSQRVSLPPRAGPRYKNTPATLQAATS